MRKPKRQCYIKNDLCYIPLQNGQEAFTNKEYYDIVKNYTWLYNSLGYIVANINNKNIYLTKYLFPKISKRILFIDKNKFNCRKENVIELKRKCYIEDNICKIPLNNGQIAMCDVDSFEEVSKYNWVYSGVMQKHQ
jgi:hypothetical protein